MINQLITISLPKDKKCGKREVCRPLAKTGQQKLGTEGTSPALVSAPQGHRNPMYVHSFNLWGRKIPWRKKRQPTPVLPGKSHGQRAWQAIVHRVSKSQTQLSQHNLLLQEVRKASAAEGR